MLNPATSSIRVIMMKTFMSWKLSQSKIWGYLSLMFVTLNFVSSSSSLYPTWFLTASVISSSLSKSSMKISKPLTWSSVQPFSLLMCPMSQNTYILSNSSRLVSYIPQTVNRRLRGGSWTKYIANESPVFRRSMSDIFFDIMTSLIRPVSDTVKTLPSTMLLLKKSQSKSLPTPLSTTPWIASSVFIMPAFVAKTWTCLIPFISFIIGIKDWVSLTGMVSSERLESKFRICMFEPKPTILSQICCLKPVSTATAIIMTARPMAIPIIAITFIGLENEVFSVRPFMRRRAMKYGKFIKQIHVKSKYK